MKTAFSAAVLCLVLCCGSLNQAVGERVLKQTSVTASSNCRANNGNCRSTASVDTRAIDDAASAISRALSTAVARAQRNEDASASADAFAEAVARAYAIIVSRFVLSVEASGRSSACASGSSFGSATASAIAQATSRAFARSSNRFARASASCFASAVSRATVRIRQSRSLRVCARDSRATIYRRFVTVGFAEAVATTFANVYTAIRDNNEQAAATCTASSSANTGVFNGRG